MLQFEQMEERYLLSGIAPPGNIPPGIIVVSDPPVLQGLLIGKPSGTFDAATRTFNLDVLVQGSGPIGSQGQIFVQATITNLTFIGQGQTVLGIANVSGHGATVVNGTINLNSLPMGTYSIVITVSDNSGINPSQSSGIILFTIPQPGQQFGIIAMNLQESTVSV